MAKLFNLAKVSTATTGTGTITLGSARPGFLDFNAAGVQDGDAVTYAINDGTESEIGTGVYSASGQTLTRNVLNSTNVSSPINLSGSAIVGITPSAEDFNALMPKSGGTFTDRVVFQEGISVAFLDSQQIIVGYNSVGVIQPPSSGGIMFFSVVEQSYPQNLTACLLAYDVGSSPLLTNMVLGTSVNNHGSATLTGTTTTEGQIGIAVDNSGNFYIENRYIGNIARQFCLTFINSYRSLV